MDNKNVKVYLRQIAIAVLVFLLLGMLPGDVYAVSDSISRVSVDSNGIQANGWSRRTTISGDGRYVAFASEASNLVNGDTNEAGDIFIHDRQTGTTTRISVNSSGTEANGGSDSPNISNDGRYVAFYSDASNLVNGDNNEIGDIFVRDIQAGTTTRVSIDSSGNEANDLSSEYYIAISGDGRFVAFQSDATNLVSGDTNGVGDIFVHDRQTNQTSRVSVDSNGAQANNFSSAVSISNDGIYVTFASSATNLVSNDTNGKVDVFVYDRNIGATTLVSVNSSGEQADGGGSSPDISGNGRYIVFLSKSNNLAPGADEYEALIYVHDRQTGQTILASVYSDGYIMITGILDQPTISNEGRFVAFSFYDKSNNNGIMNIWVRDLQTNTSFEVAYGNASSFGPSLSANGSSIAFWSSASNLVNGDTNDAPDIFVYEPKSTPDLDPSVVSVIQNCPRGCISIADPIVDFTVTFSEPVTGVTTDDFSLTSTGTLTSTSIAEVVGSGKQYIVAVNTGIGVGTLRLDLIDNDSITDSTGKPLGGIGIGNGNFTAGDVYSVDRSTPVVISIVRVDPNPTTAESLRFAVTFSENVSGVDAGDFALNVTGNMTGVSVTDVSGSGSNFIITVSTGSGDGTIRLDILDNDSIQDEVGNPLGGSGTNNGDFLTGEIYTIEKTPPYVTASLLADPNPTTAESVRFSIGFTKPVSGVDVGDLTLVTTGDITGTSIINVSGSGSVFTVTVGTGSGAGTIRLDVLDNDSIVDIMNNPLGGPGVGNGNFITGAAYTINKVPVNLIVENIRSNGKNDGWVLEAGENSERGGLKDVNSTTIVLGDNAQNNQFRAILHFPTFYLPNDAVITRVLLMIRREGLVGSDPFATHQNIAVDIRSGAFGFFGPFQYRGLQISDFESPSSRDSVGVIQNNPFNNWYWSYLDSSAFEYINRYGITQIRLRFQVDDDNDFSDDYLRFYSGDHNELAGRPRLLIEYYRR